MVLFYSQPTTDKWSIVITTYRLGPKWIVNSFTVLDNVFKIPLEEKMVSGQFLIEIEGNNLIKVQEDRLMDFTLSTY